MMCVPNVTVPERTAEPPVLWKASVTFSHQRLSVGSRTGAPVVRCAGPTGGDGTGVVGTGVGADVDVATEVGVGVGIGAGDAECPLTGVELEPSATTVGDPGAVVGVSGRLPCPGGDSDVPVAGVRPSSGTKVTSPVGATAVPPIAGRSTGTYPSSCPPPSPQAANTPARAQVTTAAEVVRAMAPRRSCVARVGRSIASSSLMLRQK
jgi:hypothetical protein